jgi:hypothetical protein
MRRNMNPSYNSDFSRNSNNSENLDLDQTRVLSVDKSNFHMVKLPTNCFIVRRKSAMNSDKLNLDKIKLRREIFYAEYCPSTFQFKPWIMKLTSRWRYLRILTKSCRKSKCKRKRGMLITHCAVSVSSSFGIWLNRTITMNFLLANTRLQPRKELK